jgi:hypothetical protein
MIKYLVSIFVVFLSGCATYVPVSADYKGATAYISDSSAIESSTRIKLFFVLAVEGKEIHNSSGATKSANFGRGFSIVPSSAGRYVEARPQKLTLKATHAMGAPIHEFAAIAAGTFYSVQGAIGFTPKSGGKYVVKGELTKESSSVWIEDVASGEVVSENVISSK